MHMYVKTDLLKRDVAWQYKLTYSVRGFHVGTPQKEVPELTE